MQHKPGPNAYLCCIIFYGFILTVCGFGLYSIAKEIDKVRRVELSNCTTADAHHVWDLKSGESGWVVHVNVSVPASHSQPPYATQTMSLLRGTNPSDNYFTNQTFQCYASTRDSHYVALTPQKPDGDDIFGIVVLSIVFFLFVMIMVLSTVGTYQDARTPAPTNSSVRGSEQITLARSDTRTSSDSSTTIVAPPDLAPCDLGRGDHAETMPSVTKKIVVEAAKAQISLDESRCKVE